MNSMPVLLEILLLLRLEMQLGKSISAGLAQILSKKADPLSKSMRVWSQRLLAGQKSEIILPSLPELTKSPIRKGFIQVLEKGLKGSPIDQYLLDLEKEFYLLSEDRAERAAQILPLKLLAPLTLLILPGIMLILVAPVLNSLLLDF